VIFLGRHYSPHQNILPVRLAPPAPIYMLWRCKNLPAQQRLNYQPIIGQQTDWPEWLDLTLQKALQVDPEKRYQHLSEFLYDLRHPNPALGRQLTLQAAYPIRLWQTLCFVQALLIALLLVIG
jgi:hypothetical protein